MNSRERVFMALAHEQPDRPPVSATYTPEIAAMLRSIYGREGEDLGYLMGNDLIKTTVGIENSCGYSSEPTYTCPFGVKWRNVSNETGSYNEIIGGALCDDPQGEKLAAYQIPDPNAPSLYEPVKKAVARYGKEKFIIGSCQCTLFETAWYLHGLEDTLCDMLVDEDYVNAMLDKLQRYPMDAGLRMIEAGVDMIWLGDDVATQREMLFSLDLWRKFFKPRYASLFQAFKRAKKDIVLAYHSCGNCEAILDDMIEIGLEVLNPIQPLAIDPEHVKKRYGDRLTLFGAIDVQRLMPMGSPAEVEAAVRHAQRVLGKDGGYILSPAHHIQADTKLENIQAFYRAALEA